MKFLTRKTPHNFFPNNTRFIYAETETPADQLPENPKEKIDALLDNPAKCSYADIKWISENPQILKPHRHRFHHLTAYFLTISQSKGEFAPPRQLYVIAQTPDLFNLLPETMRREVNNQIDKQLKKVGDLIRNENWSFTEMADVCSLLEIIRQKQKKDKSLQTLREQLIEKLTKHLGKFGANPHDIFSNKKLTPTERLLMLEVGRTLGRHGQDKALTFCNPDILKNYLKSLENTIKEILKDPKSPDVIYLWEIIESLYYDSNAKLSYGERLMVRRLGQQARYVQLIYTLKEQPVMLPSHWRALEQIKPVELEVEPTFFKMWYVAYTIDDKSEISKEDQKQYYIHETKAATEKLKALEKDYHAALDKHITLEKSKWKEFKKKSDDQLTKSEKDQKESIQNIETKHKETNNKLKNLISQIEDQLQPNQPSVFLRNLRKHWNNPRKIASILHFQKYQLRYEMHQHGISQDTQSELFGLGEDLKAQAESFSSALKSLFNITDKDLQKTIDEYEKAHHDYLKKSQTIAKNDELIYNFLHLGEEIGKITKRHSRDLASRFRKGQLHSSEMTALQDPNLKDYLIKQLAKTDAKAENGQRIWTKNIENLETVRQKIRDTFGSAVKDIFDQNNDFDHCLSEINQTLSQARIRSQIRSWNLPHDLLPQEVLRVATQEVWEETVNQLGTRPQFSTDEMEKFLQQVNLFNLTQFPGESTHLSKTLKENQAWESNAIEAVQKHRLSYTQALSPEELDFALRNPDSQLGQILQSGNQAEREYMKGYLTFDKNGQLKGGFPGIEGLRKLKLQTSDIRAGINHKLDSVHQQCQDIQQEFRDKNPTVGRQKLEDFINNADQTWGEIWEMVTTLRSECHQILKSSHIALMDEYIKYLKKYKVHYDSIIADGKTLLQKDQIDAYENFFINLPNLLGNLQANLDFSNGFWAQESQNQKARLERLPPSFQYLKNIGALEEDCNEELVVEKLEDVRTDFRDKFLRYEKNFNTVQDKIKADIAEAVRRNDDRELLNKYGMNQKNLYEFLEAHKKSFNEMKLHWDTFDTDNFFKDWLKEFRAGDATEKLRGLHQIADWQELTKSLGAMEDQSNQFKSFLEDYERHPDNYNQGFWEGIIGQKMQWTRASLYDYFRVIQKSLEHLETHYKRKSDRAVATIGMTVFGNTIVGKEFRRMGEDSEEERVKQFEQAYRDLDGWDIRAIMYDSTNPDEVRACINLLIETGFMHWDDPGFWEALNKLQDQVVINPAIDSKKSIYEIQELVKRACGFIWSRKVYQQWEGSVADNLNKAMAAYDREFSNLESSPTARTDVLAGMLRSWSRGEVEEVDPARYESYLVNAIKAGKMNGQPDQRFYFLAMGISVKNPNNGKSILSADVLERLQDLMAQVPHIEFFVDKLSPKKNGRIVPEEAGGVARPWNKDDFEQWRQMLDDGTGRFNPNHDEKSKAKGRAFFYRMIRKSEQARDRTQRMQRVAKDQADHDDAMLFSAEWSATQIEQALVTLSEGTTKNTPDFWRTFLAGYPLYLQELHSMIKDEEAEFGGESWWRDERDNYLREAGRIMRAAFYATQILTGNVSKTSVGRDSVTTFTKDDWEKETGYSIQAQRSKDAINQVFMGILEEEGKLGEYGDLEELNLKSDKSKADPAETNRRVQSLALGGEGDAIFSKTDSIWRSIDKFCSSGGSQGIMTVDDYEGRINKLQPTLA